MGLRLHPDSGFDQGLFVGYNADGAVEKQGYLEADDDDVVHFVNTLTDAQRPPDSAE